jgi:hypothetical protein
MTNRSRRNAAERAEARRRARRAGQGLEEDLSADEPVATGAAPRGSFLNRLFPPAPELPGKPDPLAGFAYEGPMRGVVASFYLLARHPLAWLGMGALWAVGRLILQFGTIVGIVASLVAFGALIAAGWLGWPRPWLFGLMASIVGILLYAAILALLVSGASAQNSPGEWFAVAVYREAAGLQPLFGALAGWYGGYLRRRMAAAPSGARGRSRR